MAFVVVAFTFIKGVQKRRNVGIIGINIISILDKAVSSLTGQQIFVTEKLSHIKKHYLSVCRIHQNNHCIYLVLLPINVVPTRLMNVNL
jgi:hypothetical protein